jgi:hypothetical protein
VDPEQYVPTLKTLRAGSNTRTLEPILVEGQRGVLVRKMLDSGSSIYGGPLHNLLVDQVVEENARILEDDPLSATAFTHSESTLARGAWKVRAVIATRIWSERLAPIRWCSGTSDQPFEERRSRAGFPGAGSGRACSFAATGRRSGRPQPSGAHDQP